MLKKFATIYTARKTNTAVLIIGLFFTLASGTPGKVSKEIGGEEMATDPKVNFRIPESEIERARRVARESGKTVSELFRDALSRHLDRIEIADSQRAA